MSGLVSLVGAGPGDPELLTLKAVRRLQEADLVLHDALVDPAVLRHAPRAHAFFVGKRAGRHAVDQASIHRMLVRAGRGGRRVVRLKCGDPFVLGRGGEEALALARAGVACEVIPGVSSALAAPALAGIPVTHRGLAAGFAVVSGHAESAYRPILEGIAPGSLTLVLLMSLATRGAIARLLAERGWPPSTPAAVLAAASSARAWRWIATLRELVNAPLPPDPDAPGLVCVGATVALAERLRLLEAPPRAAALACASSAPRRTVFTGPERG